MPTAAPTAGPAPRLLQAAGLVAAWQLLFAATVTWGPDGSVVAALVLPPLVALLVPVAALTVLRWWSAPWLVGVPPGTALGLLVPVALLEVLVVLQTAVPPGSVLLAFVVTGLSEELLARGVVQELLRHLAALPQVLLSGGLLALGYVVTLTALGLDAARVAMVAGMVLCFGVAHAALRRRGVPVLLLAILGALVVWPQAARETYDPLTVVASVVALVLGVWATLDEPATTR